MQRALVLLSLIGPLWFGCSGSSGAAARGGKGGGSGGQPQTGGTGGAAGSASGVGGWAADAAVDSGGTSGAGGVDDQGGAGGAPPLTGFAWHTLPSLAKKRQNAMGAAVGQTMYVIGGLDSSGPVADVEILAADQTAWTTGPSLPTPQCCAAVGVIGNVIAVAGGYASDGHTPTDALLLFDTTTGVWSSGTPMPTARANAMAAAWNGKLAVIGGGTQYGATQMTGVIELYDPSSNSWTSSTLTVTPRAGGVALVDSDARIYVVGGAIQNSLYGDPIVEIVTANGVTAAPSLALGRVQVAGGLLPSGLAIAGGWTAAGDTATAEGLVGSRSAWQPLPPMPTSRAGAASAVVNGTLIVAGGAQYQDRWIAQDVVEGLAAQ